MNFSALGSSIFGGLLIQAMPSIMKGAMKEFLGTVKLGDFIEYIDTNQNLWDKLPPDQQASLMDIGPRLGNMDWFNYDWVVVEGRKSSPALYKAIEDWPEGQEWLKEQIENIKVNIKGGVNGKRRENNPA